MASSSSSSSYVNRSTSKILEYTSCIDTQPYSTITTSTNLNTHSSFDQISQPKNVNRLELNLHRNIEKLDLNQTKTLDRTESISLPSTPTEQISSSSALSFNHPCQSLLNLSSDLSSKSIHSISSTDFMTNTTSEQISIELNSNSTSPLLQSTITSSSINSNIPISYGVDWSEQVCSTSHCWFSFNPTDPTSSPACSFYTCKNPKPTLILSLVRCESCLIVIHTHHLTNISLNDLKINIPSCRPSFRDDDNDTCESNDQHFWSNLSLLSKPCSFCKRKSTSSSIFNHSKTTYHSMNDMSNNKSPIPGSPLLSTTSNGFQCLWCLRCFHRRCWEQVFTRDDTQICDYGVYRNIIVRPQWIRRISRNPSRFRAQYLSKDDSEKAMTPLLLFINKRSGGQSGEKIYHKLLRLLNPRQVFLLENDQTIHHALEIYSSLSNIRICVFGGDGTVGWILGRLAEIYPSLTNPPVCICPLGTGNDLSRVLSWGEQYDPKRLLSTLIQIPDAQVIALDRWQVTIDPLDEDRNHLPRDRRFLSLFTPPKFIRDTKRPSYQNHRTLPNTYFINYMSFGLDAAIALEFHDRRSRDPRKFSSPLKNKLMYLNESRKYLNDFARSKMWNLRSYIRLFCDGENLTDSIKNCHTLLVLNIPGYASGTNPWGKSSHSTTTTTTTTASSITIQKDSDSFEQISTSSVDCIDLPANTHDVYEVITLNECPTTSMTTINNNNNNFTGKFERQDFGDKKIEVVGLSTTHMATIHIGFRGTRIAQCNQLRIELCCPMTAQMDGEPFYLPESVAVNITHAGQVLVLKNENR